MLKGSWPLSREQAQKPHRRILLLKAVVVVGLGRRLCVLMTSLDKCCRLLSVHLADIFEIFVESDTNGVVLHHPNRGGVQRRQWASRRLL